MTLLFNCCKADTWEAASEIYGLVTKLQASNYLGIEGTIIEEIESRLETLVEAAKQDLAEEICLDETEIDVKASMDNIWEVLETEPEEEIEDTLRDAVDRLEDVHRALEVVNNDIESYF